MRPIIGKELTQELTQEFCKWRERWMVSHIEDACMPSSQPVRDAMNATFRQFSSNKVEISLSIDLKAAVEAIEREMQKNESVVKLRALLAEVQQKVNAEIDAGRDVNLVVDGKVVATLPGRL